MKKNRIQISFLSIILATGFVPIAFAQEATTPALPEKVTFAVTVGPLECKDGQGNAYVTFANTPEVGGSYEVMGEMITKNGIALNRNVFLPTGSYSWKGVVNGGYEAVGITEGSFTVPACPSATVTPKQETPISVVPLKIEKEKAPDVSKDSEPKNEAIASTSTEVSENEVSGNAQYIIFGLILLGAVFAYFGFRPQKVLPPQ
jgi:hypothetical protein